MAVHTKYAGKKRKFTQNLCRNAVSKDITSHTQTYTMGEGLHDILEKCVKWTKLVQNGIL